MSYIQELFADRIGGNNFGKDTTLYKFEKIKRAKKLAKEKYPDLEMVLHTDQGSVYASKSFNDLLPLYNIIHSMSRAGTPTDNAAMEAINGWIKAEIFNDLHITSNENIERDVAKYIELNYHNEDND